MATMKTMTMSTIINGTVMTLDEEDGYDDDGDDKGKKK